MWPVHLIGKKSQNFPRPADLGKTSVFATLFFWCIPVNIDTLIIFHHTTHWKFETFHYENNYSNFGYPKIGSISLQNFLPLVILRPASGYILVLIKPHISIIWRGSKSLLIYLFHFKKLFVFLPLFHYKTYIFFDYMNNPLYFSHYLAEIKTLYHNMGRATSIVSNLQKNPKVGGVMVFFSKIYPRTFEHRIFH